MDLVARVTRELYRREAMPARVRWWLAAAGMCDWYRVLARELTPRFDGDAPRAKAVLARLAGATFERRWVALGAPPELVARELGPTMAALYRVDARAKAAWIFEPVGGAPRGARARLRAARLLRERLPSADARWREVTTHLGELLIVMTERLPDELPHARKVIGDVCFTAGVRFAERVKNAFELPATPENAPKEAIEVLRMSEYVFRVNPDHWSAADASSNRGFLEGTACPWYERPGWNGAHCGIFGQFQAGIASVFGLKYHLAKTIPKHGGTTCRVDLKPLPAASLRKDARPPAA